MGQPVIIQIENIYYPILAIIGLPANLVTIVILSRGNCGLSKCITRYLMAMAVADLLSLIFDVILYEINDAYFPYSFLNYTPICSVNIALYYGFIDCSVWLTVAFTFDRFVAICYQTLRTKYCTEKTVPVVIAVVCFLSMLENIPNYFVLEPREIIDNIPWSCNVKSSFYTSAIWAAFLWLEAILTPFAPFVLIVLFNALTIKHIVLANRVRSGLRGNIKVQNHTDPEMENRRKSIILLLAISGNFILLWMVNFIVYICVLFTGTQFLAADYNDSFTILEQSGLMLMSLSACTNTFIYAVSQSKFREELKNGPKWIASTVIAKKDNRVFVIKLKNGKTCKKHMDETKLRHTDEPEQSDEETFDDQATYQQPSLEKASLKPITTAARNDVTKQPKPLPVQVLPGVECGKPECVVIVKSKVTKAQMRVSAEKLRQQRRRSMLRKRKQAVLVMLRICGRKLSSGSNLTPRL
uniref:probable G-protein coupled receptor 139 n=1 Tax=Pristiophorus japonicus TaxID=55135 RepID=UPI00398EAD2D